MTIQDLKDKNLILLECISGSRAYGLDTPGSDTDIKGVFYLPRDQFYTWDYLPQVNNESHDEVYYELGRFIELLSKNNPNILELLATPKDCVRFRHPIMEKLKPELFLSKLCRDTFAGYAYIQVRKATGYKKKAMNPVEPERKGVLDFCFVTRGYSSLPAKEWLTRRDYKQEFCGLAVIPHTKGLYALFYDPSGKTGFRGIVSGEDANEVSLSSVPNGMKETAYLYFNIESYSAYCKEYKEYWEWVGKRNEVRYQGNIAHGKHYDAKNMMHTIRLLQVAEELLRTGKLQVRRPNREQLLHIKAGGMDYDELLIMADDLMQQIGLAWSTSNLLEQPDTAAIRDLLVSMRTTIYHDN